jgi:hypothetical protein
MDLQEKSQDKTIKDYTIEPELNETFIIGTEIFKCIKDDKDSCKDCLFNERSCHFIECSNGRRRDKTGVIFVCAKGV